MIKALESRIVPLPMDSLTDCDPAIDYAERHGSDALLIWHDGQIVIERYGDRFAVERAHPLFSGTKSFWGVCAVAAQEDGLLALDEPASKTIAEWRPDERKARVTIRQLLNLTSGIPFGGLGKSVPPFARSIETPLVNEPGTKFTYGGIPLQVFGETLRRKLAPSNRTPCEYLKERILNPIGLQVASWRTTSDGFETLPTGAAVTAREWLKFGQLVYDSGRWAQRPLLAEKALGECFQGSAANPRYGLGFWLRPIPDPPDVIYASGSAGQMLAIIPSRKTIIIHFGHSSSFRQSAFLRAVFQMKRKAAGSG